MSVCSAHLYIVIVAGRVWFKLKSHEGVVDGVAHRGLDSPAAVGMKGVVIGEVQALDSSPGLVGDPHTMAD